MTNNESPCDWGVTLPDAEDECGPCGALADLPCSVQQRIIGMAVDLLWRWSGRRFGVCPVSVRPCREGTSTLGSTFWGGEPQAGLLPRVGGWSPALIGGKWFNIGCGRCASGCLCEPDATTTIELPGPVAAIDEVWVGGVRLTPDAYLLRGNVLARLDGKPWPSANDEFGDPTAADSATWEISYQKGIPVPEGGRYAAYRLACELAKAYCGDNDCALPSRVQTITRQGVSVAVLDSFEGLEKGRTGIWEIDSWLSSISFSEASPPQVYSPDVSAAAHRGTALGLGIGGRR